MDREPMTQEAYDHISKEFMRLNSVIKPQVNREKQIAAELGDRSENAEYHAAKEKLRHIDKRLKHLSRLLNSAQIIDPELLDHTHVCFGTTVTLEDIHSGEELCVTVFGAIESEPQSGIISFKAPMAKALLGKSEGDEISIELPTGKKEYEILSLTYLPIMRLKKEPFFEFKIA